MSVEEQKEVVCSDCGRRIPSTVATQFPDNVDKPFWAFRELVSDSDLFFDCYVSFKEFNCNEYLWDWKGRKLDEFLVKRLISTYEEFFRANPLGKQHFITFRISNGNGVEELGRLYMSIISSNDFALSRNLFSPPVFEIAHSADSSNDLIHFSKLYSESVAMANEKFEHGCLPKFISVIPTHQFNKNLGWYSQLSSYLTDFRNSFRCNVEYIRPFIPRAEIANTMGFVGSVIATKRALASYVSFSNITGVAVHPVVDASPLLFRGGLSPGSVNEFISTYPGARTVSITSSFRYNYDVEDVKRAVYFLNRVLPKNKSMVYSKSELDRMRVLEGIFAKNYAKAVRKLPSLDDIPEKLEIQKRSVDPSIRFSFSLYSLGIPPELVGTGNALVECIRDGMVKDLEHFYPNIKPDLRKAGSLLNRENIEFLSKQHKGWNSLSKEINLIEDYTDSELGPDSADSFMHRNYTSNIFHLRQTKRDFSRDLLAAARLRHCLG